MYNVTTNYENYTHTDDEHTYEEVCEDPKYTYDDAEKHSDIDSPSNIYKEAYISVDGTVQIEDESEVYTYTPPLYDIATQEQESSS